jgi:Arc/MetJ-type ribon-helix-helix transcriptional regulator
MMEASRGISGIVWLYGTLMCHVPEYGGDHSNTARTHAEERASQTAWVCTEESDMLPLREKVFVRLPKDLAAALDRDVEKRGRETPGMRRTRSDVIRACLHRSLRDELQEMATINAQGAAQAD